MKKKSPRSAAWLTPDGPLACAGHHRTPAWRCRLLPVYLLERTKETDLIEITRAGYTQATKQNDCEVGERGLVGDNMGNERTMVVDGTLAVPRYDGPGTAQCGTSSASWGWARRRLHAQRPPWWLRAVGGDITLVENKSPPCPLESLTKVGGG